MTAQIAPPDQIYLQKSIMALGAFWTISKNNSKLQLPSILLIILFKSLPSYHHKYFKSLKRESKINPPAPLPPVAKPTELVTLLAPSLPNPTIGASSGLLPISFSRTFLIP